MPGIPYWWLQATRPAGQVRAALEWAWRLGMDSLLLGPPRLQGVDWGRVAAELEAGPMRPAAILVEVPPYAPSWDFEAACREHLAAVEPEAGRRAIARLVEAAGIGARVRCPLLVVSPGLLPVPAGWRGNLAQPGPEPAGLRETAAAIPRRDRDAALDRCCRNLHSAWKTTGEARLCLRNGYDLAGLDGPDELAHLVEDLGSDRIGLWLDVAAASIRGAAGGASAGAYLDRLSPFLAGVSLGDGRPGEAGLPPGTGVVDWPLVGDYLKLPGRSLPWVLELAPAAGRAGLEAALGELRRRGL